MYCSPMLRLRPADMLTFRELYLGRGIWHGKQILPAGWVEQTMTPKPVQPDQPRRVPRAELDCVKRTARAPSAKTVAAGEPRTDAGLVIVIIGLAASLILIVIGSCFKKKIKL